MNTVAEALGPPHKTHLTTTPLHICYGASPLGLRGPSSKENCGGVHCKASTSFTILHAAAPRKEHGSKFQLPLARFPSLHSCYLHHRSLLHVGCLLSPSQSAPPSFWTGSNPDVHHNGEELHTHEQSTERFQLFAEP